MFISGVLIVGGKPVFLNARGITRARTRTRIGMAGITGATQQIRGMVAGNFQTDESINVSPFFQIL